MPGQVGLSRERGSIPRGRPLGLGFAWPAVGRSPGTLGWSSPSGPLFSILRGCPVLPGAGRRKGKCCHFPCLPPAILQALWLLCEIPPRTLMGAGKEGGFSSQAARLLLAVSFSTPERAAHQVTGGGDAPEDPLQLQVGSASPTPAGLFLPRAPHQLPVGNTLSLGLILQI